MMQPLIPSMASGFAPVPARYRGVWVRTLLQTPTQEDRSSFVRWLQTSHWHADLRVPTSARSLTQTNGAYTLEQGISQQGFCGVTEVRQVGADEVCTWHRRFDYQPPRPDADTGTMVFETAHRVVERGIHAEYLEIWERLPESLGPCMALAGRTLTGADNGERLLQAGSCLMRVRPWAECEISYGRVEQGQWHIERSTLPELEGQMLPLQLSRDNAQTAHVQLGNQHGAFTIMEREAAP